MSAARPRAGVLSHSSLTEGTKKPRATIRETDAAGTADAIALGAHKDGIRTKLVTLILQKIFAMGENAPQA